ncbi:hypothetical protein ACOMHN_034568 [Nucella lapillus]
MGDCTLLVRHLPSSLTKEEKEDFLRHFGAVRVDVMNTRGPLKHTAFAEFPNKDLASQALGKLHQVEMLGRRLVVEVAHTAPRQHLADDKPRQSHKTKKEGDEESEGKEKKEEEENEENALDFSFLQWGLKYPRRRRLYFLYPPPSHSILTNICHALTVCPKLYVQVLHLMNKMDLPAPFGPVTPQPPMAPDVGATEGYADKLQAEAMEMSSTEESELESDPDTSKPAEAVPRKRKAGGDRGRKQMKKRARLAMALFHNQSSTTPASETKPSTPALPLGEVFEKAGEGGGGQRKIQLRLPGAVMMTSTKQPVVDVGGSVGSVEESVLPLPPPPPPPPGLILSAEEAPQSSGFGVLTPASKTTEEKEEQDDEEMWGETKFISRSELRKGRLSHREMEELSLFRYYKEGEPSRRLYIKNVAKQVTEEDLHWVFGRYVNWDDESQKTIFDIRLMKEGRMKGQAFVTLATEEQAAKAVRDTNAFVLKGKPMVVHYARSAKQQQEQNKS